MELKLGYKQSQVGVIPDDWEPTPIHRFSAFVTKGATPTTYGFRWEDDGVVFLRSECVSDHGIDLTQAMFISNEAHAVLARSEVRSGDILMTITGNVGRAVRLPANFGPANINQHIARIRVTDPQVDREFVYQFLLQPKIRARYATITTGQAYPQISLPQVRHTEVPLPPPTEQHAIAVALSDVDALIDGLDRLIGKKRDLKQAAMQQLLTGQTRLPGFHSAWEVKRLRDAAEIIMGQSPDSRHYNRSGYGVPLIQGNADIEGRRSIARVWTAHVTKEGREGDLLLTVRAPVGSVGIVSERGCLGRGVCALRPRDTSAEFMFQALILAERAWKVLEQGSTFTSANSAQVAAFSLPMPPSLLEQTAIAEVLSDMDAELAALEQRREKTVALKQGMMQELLTGRTRLR